MSGIEFLGLALLAGLVWFSWSALKARELALRAAREVCAAENLQLLDETVAVTSLRPARDTEGRLAWRRVYGFEYSDTGNNRRRGSLVLLGDRVLEVNVGLHLVPGQRTWH